MAALIEIASSRRQGNSRRGIDLFPQLLAQPIEEKQEESTIRCCADADKATGEAFEGEATPAVIDASSVGAGGGAGGGIGVGDGGGGGGGTAAATAIFAAIAAAVAGATEADVGQAAEAIETTQAKKERQLTLITLIQLRGFAVPVSRTLKCRQVPHSVDSLACVVKLMINQMRRSGLQNRPG